jgi:hypothetical protein
MSKEKIKKLVEQKINDFLNSQKEFRKKYIVGNVDSNAFNIRYPFEDENQFYLTEEFKALAKGTVLFFEKIEGGKQSVNEDFMVQLRISFNHKDKSFDIYGIETIC